MRRTLPIFCLSWLCASGGCFPGSSPPTPGLKGVFYHQQPGIEHLAYSGDGKVLASAGGTTIVVWDVSNGTLLGVLKGHQNLVDCVAYDKNRSVLFSGDYDGVVKVWDVTRSTEL